MFRAIEFISQQAILRGRLYLPKRISSKKYPVVIMAHGFTTTIHGMTADKYAERFRKADFAVLLYDHRNLGISDGVPRQEINFWVQSRGYIDAIDFVFKQPEIDTNKIIVWGSSMSAREAFLVGSVDERVKAIIAMVPAFGDHYPLKDKDSGLYTFAKETLLEDDILGLPNSRTERVAVVSHDQINNPSVLKELTAYRWFMEYGGRFGTNWQNVVSFSNIETPKDFHLSQCAAHLKAPILMIVAKNDEMAGANPNITAKIFSLIMQPKEWVDISGGHFGLLDYPSMLFEKSSKAQINFLKRQLDEKP
ncbi:alpha/beta hydrolase [Flagellimonas profundi]|uniref:Alpha/beta hydrolase n=1 Tax=Flagellimonas profundi TaxID=2915620 RepID=A0ABS3FJZ4_9FLAO|nr:alpha/beta fold hydrolase [Allomuricauda profundi]MBO0343015.1 alpha/beta hydrolase [Allomuricauda profundi]